MKTYIPVALAIVALSIPTLSFAATYSYVTTSGSLQTVEASNPQQAITSAPNRALNSGVALITPTQLSTEGSLYYYVTLNGSLGSVRASTDAQALLQAENRAPTSGVITASSMN